MNITTTKGGQRLLTPEGEHAFQLAYESAGIFESTYRPIVRFSKEAAAIIRAASECRRKAWKSSSAWNSEADYVGLLGELAAAHYMGVNADTVLSDFLNGLRGDPGHDLVVDSLKLDVKSTKSEALRFKFSKTNKHAHLADAFLFVYVMQSGREVWCHLLGFAHRKDIRPYLRDDGNRMFARGETLRREGVMLSVRSLKPSKSLSQPLLTNNQ